MVKLNFKVAFFLFLIVLKRTQTAYSKLYNEGLTYTQSQEDSSTIGISDLSAAA